MVRDAGVPRVLLSCSRSTEKLVSDTFKLVLKVYPKGQGNQTGHWWSGQPGVALVSARISWSVSGSASVALTRCKWLLGTGQSSERSWDWLHLVSLERQKGEGQKETFTAAV